MLRKGQIFRHEEVAVFFVMHQVEVAHGCLRGEFLYGGITGNNGNPFDSSFFKQHLSSRVVRALAPLDFFNGYNWQPFDVAGKARSLAPKALAVFNVSKSGKVSRSITAGTIFCEVVECRLFHVAKIPLRTLFLMTLYVSFENVYLGVPVSKRPALRIEILDQLLREASTSPVTLDELTYDLNERLAQQAGPSDTDVDFVEVLPRTVRADLNILRKEFGVEIRVQRRYKEGATYSYENPFQSRHHSGLSPDEASDVRLMLRKLRRFISDDQMRFITKGLQATNPFNSLLRLFSPKARPISEAFIGELGAPVLFDSVVQAYQGAKHIELLAEAIVDGRVIQVIYQPFEKPKIEALFHPYVLKQYNNRWFCIGHNPHPEFEEQRKSNPYTTFALDRIQDLRVIPHGQLQSATEAERQLLEYKRSPIVDWESEVFRFLVGPSWPRDVWETPYLMKRPEPIEVAFHPKRLGYERTKPLHDSFTQTKRFWGKEQWPIRRYRVHLTEEFIQQILMRQPNAIVLSPPSAVEAIRERLNESQERWNESC